MRVALYEVITPGNVGAIARVMKNFGYKELLLIKPQCNHLASEAFQRATKAKEIVKNAKMISEDEVFTDYVVGTTSKAFTRRPHRQAVTPEELNFLPKKFTLLLGREDHGLSNELLTKCDSVITIPTSTNYSSLNISHALAIILYSLSKKEALPGIASKKLREVLLKTVEGLGVDESLMFFLEKVVNRSTIFEREAKAIIGYLKELKS
jgi:tRNA/rRNA methyltransferase